MSRDWELLFCVLVVLFTVLIAGFFACGIDVAVLGGAAGCLFAVLVVVFAVAALAVLLGSITEADVMLVALVASLLVIAWVVLVTSMPVAGSLPGCG